MKSLTSELLLSNVLKTPSTFKSNCRNTKVFTNKLIIELKKHNLTFLRKNWLLKKNANTKPSYIKI